LLTRTDLSGQPIIITKSAHQGVYKNYRARILDDLEKVPCDKAILIIRHADRDGALNALIDAEQNINDRGRERARQMGLGVHRFPRLAFSSSPVHRCVETCGCISTGHGTKATIEETEVLGMRAPTMLRPRDAYALMQTLGLERFIDEYVADKLDPNVVMPCQRGAQLLFHFAEQRMKSTGADLTVLVSHDMLLTPAMVKYFGFDIHKNGLCPFLDGMVLYPMDDGFEVRHADRVLRLDHDCLPT